VTGAAVGRRRLRILLCAPFAAAPRHGGLSWVGIHWAVGLQRLGHEVHLVEPVADDRMAPAGAHLGASAQATYRAEIIGAAGLEGSASLLDPSSRATVGLGYEDLRALAASADLLVNAGGALTDPALVEPVPVRVYLDLDPGFTQLWHAQGIDLGFAGHTHFATVGPLLGRPGCPVPDVGRDWIGVLPPVVADMWPTGVASRDDALTTVGNWRGYGSVVHQGVHFGQKAHALRPLLELPVRTGRRFRLAMGIHPGEADDLAALRANGWELVDPDAVAATPAAFREFVAGSWGEFGLAKSGYVAGQTGWFSDRSACYLAAGRPVFAQATGWESTLPAGEGLLCFRTADDLASAAEAVRRDYPRHARAARRLAEAHLDARVVLPPLLERVGLS
jgi:hypothetical protein